jgi:acyl-coenzyme A thioesterase PaaI-like protein
VTPERLVHHELCFACGRTNLFGLLMDVERTQEHGVKARGFIKQDHQGAVPGHAHEGILLAALSEAMSFACGADARADHIELQLHAAAPVGAFIEVEARVLELGDEACLLAASASVDAQPVASARGRYYRR